MNVHVIKLELSSLYGKLAVGRPFGFKVRRTGKRMSPHNVAAKWQTSKRLIWPFPAKTPRLYGFRPGYYPGQKQGWGAARMGDTR